MDTKLIAEKVVRDIFDAGSWKGKAVHRIAFKCGGIGNEIEYSGLAEQPLADLVEKSLNKHLGE